MRRPLTELVGQRHFKKRESGAVLLELMRVHVRLETERQALALMMELVRGIPITKYCDQERLATKDRLILFMQVCHAIQHAHQKGIITTRRTRRIDEEMESEMPGQCLPWPRLARLISPECYVPCRYGGSRFFRP
jgi:hypothetical protein